VIDSVMVSKEWVHFTWRFLVTVMTNFPSFELSCEKSWQPVRHVSTNRIGQQSIRAGDIS